MDVAKVEASRPREAPELGNAQSRIRDEKEPGGQEPPAGSPEAPVLNPDEMDKAMTDLSSCINLKVEQTTDDESGRKVVRILTRDGERLLRQMPTEAALKLLEHLRSGSAEGLFSSVI